MGYKISQNPSVSVCIPVFNGIKYLNEALDSILNQSFAHIEIIAIDDNSSDGSYELLLSYAIHDPRIKVYRNKVKKGLVGNWNECIKYANGVWIKFVFQDDIIHSSCIEKQLKCAESMSSDYRLIFSKRRFFFEDDTPSNMEWYRQKKSYWDLFLDTRFITPDMVIKSLIKHPSMNLFGEPTSFLIEKNIFSKYGLFDSNFRQLCDLEFWLRVGTEHGFGFVNEELVLFRVHGNSTSASNLSEKEYESKYLDKLLLHRKWLYDDNYSFMRLQFSSWPSSLFFQTQFEISARRAKLSLEKTPNNNAMAAWASFKEKFPDVHSASMKSFFSLAIKYFIARTSILLKLSFNS
ncbi:glycosyltransferase family 2 protein [Methylotuvimicrobium sp.]|uniref:glycosyltransferase family 2 protein n=1 Tax=Methylotuvimicrobium sp. TaxID=2822413 RepID=UPI003D64B5CB